jgi:hypothetical protein
MFVFVNITTNRTNLQFKTNSCYKRRTWNETNKNGRSWLSSVSVKQKLFNTLQQSIEVSAGKCGQFSTLILPFVRHH